MSRDPGNPIAQTAAPAGTDRFSSGALAARYRLVRQATERLCAPLSAEDCAVQSMPDASPAKWHLAHTTWFFETFVLAAALPSYAPHRPEYAVLFNSYYNLVGDRHPRPRRGLLTRPSLREVLTYRSEVDDRMLEMIGGRSSASLSPQLADILDLGLNHEQQHQELILMDIKHLFWLNPLRPAYAPTAAPGPGSGARPRWIPIEGGIRRIGHGGPGFCFDNERPPHRAVVEAFEIASRPSTNGEFAMFIEDGCYRRPELWLSDGWDTVLAQGCESPLYWERGPDGWRQFTLSGMRPLEPSEPVCHVSYYEADAFARWSGARLPTEQEWETAAVGSAAALEGNFMEDAALHPRPCPANARGDVPAQLFGDVWEWTASAYAPYPGYAPPAGALGEYNGKFMSNQMVLRGGACVTPRSHLRPTYRNFFYPSARWQFGGIRLARDAR